MLEKGRGEKIPSHPPDEIFPEEFETFMHLKLPKRIPLCTSEGA